MDYQAGSCGGKVSVVRNGVKLWCLSLFILIASFSPLDNLGAQFTQNPLTSTVTITAGVLVSPGVRPDTPPIPPSPGPVNMSSVTDVAIFRGIAYPGSTITILKNGFIVSEMPANPDGTFDIRVRDLAVGTYSFGIRAEDGNRLKSKLLLFTVVVSSGVATILDGIFLPPTITSDKTEVKRGDTITFTGYSTPDATVRLSFIPTFSTFEIIKQSKANASGTWEYVMDSSLLAGGDYEVRAKSILPADLSPYSDPLVFKVGTKNTLRPKNELLAGFRKKCDLNDDSRVNLLDFSIMAFWYKRLGFPAKVDLNTDSNVNLTDLSILAYCWTG